MLQNFVPCRFLKNLIPDSVIINWKVKSWYFQRKSVKVTAWKVFIFGVILVGIFPHATEYVEMLLISPYSVWISENADQNNSEYKHFLHSELYAISRSFNETLVKYWTHSLNSYQLASSIFMWCFARFGTICTILKMWKHPWRSITFSKVLKVALLHGSFSRFLNCTNVTKSRNASHMLIFLP